jgi:hypothetical protein
MSFVFMIGFLLLRLLEPGIGGREVEYLGLEELVGGATALVGRLEQGETAMCDDECACLCRGIMGWMIKDKRAASQATWREMVGCGKSGSVLVSPLVCRF